MRLHPGRSWHRVGEVTVSLLAGALLIAASGSAEAAPKSSLTSDSSLTSALSANEPTLCESVANLTHLVVRRTDASPQNHFRFSFPAMVTVNDVALVREAARSLSALPRMPSGVHSCPADWGITYHLSFSSNARTFPTISIAATGCQSVSGLVPVRWVAPSPEFWRILGKAMGLTKADQQTFAGSRP